MVYSMVYGVFFCEIAFDTWWVHLRVIKFNDNESEKGWPRKISIVFIRYDSCRFDKLFGLLQISPHVSPSLLKLKQRLKILNLKTYTHVLPNSTMHSYNRTGSWAHMQY